MSIITSCLVPNKSNEGEKLTVLTKWSDNQIKVLVVRDDRTLMVGETALNDFSTLAEHFHKPLNEYIQDLKDILSGKRQDVDFSLKDDKFFWKRKAWLLGQVKVRLSPSETDHLLDVVFFQTDNLSKVNKKLSENEKSMESLNKSNADLTYKMNQMVLLKEQMETEWYRACLVMINSMKAKIREQQKEIEKLKKSQEKTVYDGSTDESDNEPNENAKNDVISPSVITKKPAGKRSREESVRLAEKRRKMETEKVKQNDVIKEKEVNNKSKKENAKISVTKTSQENKMVDESKNTEVNEFTNDVVSNKKPNEVKDKISNIEVDKDKLPKDTDNLEKLRKNKVTDKNGQLENATINKQKDTEYDEKDFEEETQVIEGRSSSQVDPEPIASTSKTLLSTIGEDEETPDILSEESFCDMELKFEEEKDDENDLKGETQKFDGNKTKDKETTEINNGDKENTEIIDKKEENINGNKTNEIENEEIDDERRLLLQQDSEEMVF